MKIMPLTHTTVRALLVSLMLLTGALPSTAQNPDRSRPPELLPPPSLRLPPIQRFHLSNGVSVMLLEKHEVPLVQIALLVRAGSVNDPAGKEGLAAMTAQMMTEGAGARDALALADAIDFLGADINASAGLHRMDVSMFAPLSKLDSALALMADVALHPAFPRGELERKQKQWLTTLLQWRDEPNALASVMFSSTLYGAHPYGRPGIGTEASIRALTVDDLRRFHAAAFTSNNASLIVVGDVDRRSITRRLERAFGRWRKGKETAPSLPMMHQVESTSVTLVDKPGAAQTVIRVGRIGVPRITEDYWALVVMNTILGGSFTSRLNQNLRETHGYTYGASSSFQFRLLPGPFVVGTSVQTAITDSALAEVMKELRRMREPVSDEELTRAKNYVALGFPSDFQTASQIAGRLEEISIYGLPADYFNTYTENILAVTKDDVLRVARRYLDPDRVAIVLVGDRSAIGEKVSALSLGPLTARTVDDVLGPAPVISE